MSIVGNGLLFGLILSMFIGPVFFALIQTSIEKGFSAGVGMAIGVSVSDAFYIFLIYLGISKLINTESFQVFFGVAGGVLLLSFGLYSILRPVLARKLERQKNESPKSWFQQIMKGFVLNGINPTILFFWIGVISLASTKYDYSGNEIMIFFVAILCTVLTVDILKSYLANRLRSFITVRFIRIMNRVVGVALIAFALKLFLGVSAQTANASVLNLFTP
ncbi:MAG: LysE family translocator [Cyclobacteriaceae bacterium]